MSITFPTTNLKVPSGITALPSGMKRPAFGTLYGFDAQQGGGGTPWAQAYSISLDGTNDVMTIPQGAFDLGSGNWTFSIWVKADALTSTPQRLFIVEGDGRSPSARFCVWAKSTSISITDWWNTIISYTASISDSTWYHVVARKEGSGTTDISLFVNGTEQATGYFPSTPDFGDDQATTKVGTDQAGGTAFGGLIDEFAFWSSALSDADRTAIYNSGTPTDLTDYSPVGWWRMGDNDGGTGTTITDQGSGSNNGTLTNGPTYSPAVPPGYSRKSVDFDGTDDYVDCGGASTFSFTNGSGNDEPFSVSAWVKLDSVDRARVVSKDDDSDGTREYLFGTDGDNKFTMFLGPASNNLYVRLDSASSTGTWYHWVATYDGSNSASGITLYVDGAAPAQSDVSGGSYAGMPSGGGPLRISLFGVNNSVMNGLADEVAIFDSELSASDVTAIYNSGVPADLTSLNPVGWWRMGDGTEAGSGTTIYDMSTNSNNGTLTNGPTYSSNTP